MSEPLSPNVDISKLLEINPHDLETELRSCPSYHYMFAELATDAEQIYNECVLELEQLELKLANKFKEEHAKLHSTSKYKIDALTETEIKRMYRGDETWIRLKKQELEAHTNWKKMSKAEKSFDMKNLSCMAINKRQLKPGQDRDEG